MKGIKLAEVTRETAEQWLNEDAIVVLPLGGGSKEHGGHLPMGTDMYTARIIADAITEAFPVVTLPVLNYQHFPAFIDWAGSVNIQAEHFMKLVRDIAEGLIRQGIRKIVLLDCSFSSFFPLAALASELNSEHPHIKVVVTRNGALQGDAAKLMESHQDGHAGEWETSIMLQYYPHLVHQERYEEEYRRDIDGVFRNRGHHFYVSNRMETAYGVNGNPFLATAEKGKAIIDEIVKNLAAFLAEFRDTPIDSY